MGVDVFERLGPVSGRVHNCQPQKSKLFQRLRPVSGGIHKSQPRKAMSGNVFQRLGSGSGRVHSTQPQKFVNVFQRLGSGSTKVKVHNRQPKKSVFQRLGPGSGRVAGSQPKKSVGVDISQRPRPLLDYSWVHDTIVEMKQEREQVCKSEEKCRIPCFSCVAKLEGHQNAVTGISIQAGFGKLYTGSKDKNVRVWDCKSGQCAATINLDGEVGCMLCEGPCVLVGTTNSIKVWNTQTNEEYTLAKPVGKVHAIAVIGDRLFASVEDGSILSWRFDVTTNLFKPAASLIGHKSTVVSLAAGPNKLLYSGSADKTIRIWNIETEKCQQILTGHYSSVTALIAVQQNIVSCSLDGTIKVWATVSAENGMFEAKDTHTEEWGLLSLCLANDLDGKPVLLCSCDDNTVRAFDIPSFAERGKIYSKEEVRSIQSGPAGMFFTGDAAGHVKVWKWSTPEATN